MQQQLVDAKLDLEQTIVLGAAMTGIANQMMRHVMEVFTDLAVAPALRIGFDQGVALLGIFSERDRHGNRCQGAKACDCGLARRMVAHVGQRIVDLALGRRPAAHHREIALVDATLHELAAERTGDLGIACRQHQSAGGAVQSMHQVNAAAQLLTQGGQQVDIDIGGQAARVRQQASGFVDGDQVFVLVQDFDFGCCAHRLIVGPARRSQPLPACAATAS